MQYLTNIYIFNLQKAVTHDKKGGKVGNPIRRQTAKNADTFHKRMANRYHMKQCSPSFTNNHRRASWNKTPVLSLTLAV